MKEISKNENRVFNYIRIIFLLFIGFIFIFIAILFFYSLPTYRYITIIILIITGMTLILLSKNIIVEENEKISNTVFLFIGIFMVIFAFELVFYTELVFYDYHRIYLFVTSFCIGFIFIYGAIVFKNSKIGNYVICVGFVIILIIYPLFAGIPSQVYQHEECAPYNEIDIEKEQKHLGGNCMAIDHERNILVIGTENGLRLYYLENDTYKLVGNDRIWTLTIDFNHDIYYIGTVCNGIKKYLVNDDTYIDNPQGFQDFIYIRKLAYDHSNDTLLIGEVHHNDEDTYFVYNEINSAYYDFENNLTFIYSLYRYQLDIFNYNNNSKLSVNFPENDVFDELSINIIDIEYDSKNNLIFFGITYTLFSNNNPNCSLISYNVNNNEITYYNSVKEVADICLDKKHHVLYVATINNGLILYNISSGEFKKLNVKNGFKTNYFRSLTIDDREGILYITNDESPGYYSNGDTYLYKYYLINGTITEIT